MNGIIVIDGTMYRGCEWCDEIHRVGDPCDLAAEEW